MRAALFLLFGALGLLTACGDDSETGGAGGAGGTPAAGGNDTGGGGSAATCESQASPSTRAVTFTLTNDTAADRYVLVEGALCDPFTITDTKSGDAVTFFAPDNTCNCECAGPPPQGPRRLVRVAPTETTTIPWDTRTLELCSYEESCGPDQTATAWTGWPIPVPDAQYQATFQILEAPPAYCQEDPNTPGSYLCSLDTAGDPSCEGTSQSQVTFTLGPDDLDVPVSIGP